MNASFDLALLLDAERGQHLSPESIDAGWQRLQQALALPVAAPGVAATPLKATALVLAKSFVVTSAVLVAASGAGLLGAPRDSPSALTSKAVVVSAPAAPQTPPAAAVASEAVIVTASEATEKRLPTAAAVVRPEASAGAGFDDELRLIANAKRDLDRGQGQLAAAWLSEHASRYPGGAFASEREGLKVLVACASPSAVSREAARQFAERYPASPLLDRIFRSCRAGDDNSPGAVSKQPSTK